MDLFRNIEYDYKTPDDSFIARGLQLNMMVDAINDIEGVEVPETGLEMEDLSLSNWLKVDTIDEYTTSAGVTVGGVRLQWNEVFTNKINEGSTGAGVWIDQVHFADSTIEANVITEINSNAGVTVEGVLIKDNEMSIDYLGAPTQNNTISFGAHTLTWQFSNPAGGINYSWIGAASGHLFTLSQSVGTPSAGTHMLHMDADSANVVFLHMQHAIATTRVFYTSVDGDAVGVGRFQFNTDGELEWGNGTDAVDVNINRVESGTLQVAAAKVTLGGTTTTTVVEFAHSSNYPWQWTLDANTSMKLSQYTTDIAMFYATGNTTLYGTLSINAINERTTDAGVTIEGVLLKDSEITFTDVSISRPSSGYLLVDADRVILGGTTANTIIEFAHSTTNYPWYWTVTGNTSLKLEHFTEDYITFFGTGAVTIHGATTFSSSMTLSTIVATADYNLLMVNTSGVVSTEADLKWDGTDLFTMNSDLTLGTSQGRGLLKLNGAYGRVYNFTGTYTTTGTKTMFTAVEAGVWLVNAWTSNYNAPTGIPSHVSAVVIVSLNENVSDDLQIVVTHIDTTTLTVANGSSSATSVQINLVGIPDTDEITWSAVQIG